MTALADHSALLADGRRYYESGRFAEAYALFDRLAAEDEPEAWLWLSAMHANGDGREVDHTVAYEKCLRAAELGNIQACTNLGVMLVQGEGVAPDPVAGLAWLKRAADAGDIGAAFNAASILSGGKWLDKDLKQAVVYYEHAARAGYHPAQARLGYAYRNGFGVAKDRKKAFIWLSLAARHGIGTAIAMLEGMITEMSRDELDQAQQMLDHVFEQADPMLDGARFRVQTH